MSVVTPDINFVIGAAATLEIEMKIALVIGLDSEIEAILATVTTGATTKRKKSFSKSKSNWMNSDGEQTDNSF